MTDWRYYITHYSEISDRETNDCETIFFINSTLHLSVDFGDIHRKGYYHNYYEST